MWGQVIWWYQGRQAGITRACDMFATLEKRPLNWEVVGEVYPCSSLLASYLSCVLRTRTWSWKFSLSWLGIAREVLCPLGQPLLLEFEISDCNTGCTLPTFFPGCHQSRCPLFLHYTKRECFGEGVREHSRLPAFPSPQCWWRRLAEQKHRKAGTLQS